MTRPMSPDTRERTQASGPSCANSARKHSRSWRILTGTWWSTRGRGRTNAPTATSASQMRLTWLVTASCTRRVMGTHHHRTCVPIAEGCMPTGVTLPGTCRPTLLRNPSPTFEVERSFRRVATQCTTRERLTGDSNFPLRKKTCRQTRNEDYFIFVLKFVHILPTVRLRGNSLIQVKKEAAFPQQRTPFQLMASAESHEPASITMQLVVADERG